MKALERPGHREPLKRIQIDVGRVPKQELHDCVITNTKKLFIALDTPSDFQQLHPSTWETNGSFLMPRARIISLKVVNDAAERGVALIQSYHAILTY